MYESFQCVGLNMQLYLRKEQRLKCVFFCFPPEKVAIMNFTGVVSIGCHVGIFTLFQRIGQSLFLGDGGELGIVQC